MSGRSRTVVHYMLVRKRGVKVFNVKVVPNEACVTQHKLIICQMKISDVVRKVKSRYVNKC